MPSWAGSCWYYLRYIDPQNDEALVARRAGRELLAWATAVDLYVGGAEHAVLHLLYARFWHKVLFDLGHVTHARAVPQAVPPGLIIQPSPISDDRTATCRSTRSSRSADGAFVESDTGKPVTQSHPR